MIFRIVLLIASLLSTGVKADPTGTSWDSSSYARYGQVQRDPFQTPAHVALNPLLLHDEPFHTFTASSDEHLLKYVLGASAVFLVAWGMIPTWLQYPTYPFALVSAIYLLMGAVTKGESFINSRPR